MDAISAYRTDSVLSRELGTNWATRLIKLNLAGCQCCHEKAYSVLDRSPEAGRNPTASPRRHSGRRPPAQYLMCRYAIASTTPTDFGCSAYTTRTTSTNPSQSSTTSKSRSCCCSISGGKSHKPVATGLRSGTASNGEALKKTSCLARWTTEARAGKATLRISLLQTDCIRSPKSKMAATTASGYAATSRRSPLASTSANSPLSKRASHSPLNRT